MDFIEESDTSSSSSLEKVKRKTFISWLQEQPQGQSLLATVPRSFIRDDFNLYNIDVGLPQHPINYLDGERQSSGDESGSSSNTGHGNKGSQLAPLEFGDERRLLSNGELLEYIGIIEGPAPSSHFNDQKYSAKLNNAISIYLLIHQRYVQTRQGQQEMESIIEGSMKIPCRRVFCDGTTMLPIGISSRIGVGTVKFWCPNCREVYNVGSGASVTLDGAAFGPNFPLMYLMSYKGQKARDIVGTDRISRRIYEPRIFGFRLREGISSYKGVQRKKYGPATNNVQTFINLNKI